MTAPKAKQLGFWPPTEKSPEEVIAEALEHEPVAIYAAYSGGDDSLASTHWMMTNVPGCQVLNIRTGIGIKRTHQHVEEVCERFGWPLTVLRAKEDCGQDYEEIVLQHGFPGPKMHKLMYRRLKERCVELLVRREKAKLHNRRGWRRAKVMIATGIRHDESAIRMGYAGREVNFVGAQMWVNALYWRDKGWFMRYIAEHDLPRNPVSVALGMSGECLCGAYSHEGELAMVRIADEETADYIEDLQRRVRARGFSWGWEEWPPKDVAEDDDNPDLFRPMCVGCGKVA